MGFGKKTLSSHPCTPQPPTPLATGTGARVLTRSYVRIFVCFHSDSLEGLDFV